jgi:hypothetical protein
MSPSPSNNPDNHERPAESEWRTNLFRGLPALVVGFLALLLGAYGRWIQPSRLPAQYRQHLQQRLSDYDSLSGIDNLSAARKARAAAADLSVIYRRLISLNAQAPELLWEHATFQTRHAETLRGYAHNPLTTESTTERETLQEEIDNSLAAAKQALEQLAAGSSPFKAKAVVQLAFDGYQQLLKQPVPGQALKSARELETAISSPADFTTQELDSAYLLLAQLMLEATWQENPASGLQIDSAKLQSAQNYLQQLTPASATPTNSAWLATRSLLAAYGDEQVATDLASGTTDSAAQVDTPWQSRLAELQLASISGDWQHVTFLLTERQPVGEAAVINGLARTICRLCSSPMASSREEWSRQADVGLQIVSQIAPYLPEFSELLWQAALQQAVKRAAIERELALKSSPESAPPSEEIEQPTAAMASSPIIPESITAAIATGPSAVLKHTMFALSATIEGKHDVARTHLQLIQRSGNNLSSVAHVAWWLIQHSQPAASNSAGASEGSDQVVARVDPAAEPGVGLGEELKEPVALDRLLKSLTELEASNGLGWLALAAMQLQQKKVDEARESLETADQLIGPLAVIDELLAAAKRLSK